MRFLILAGLLLACWTDAFAQTVTFNVIPNGAFVRIDGQVLELSKQRSVLLKPGTYQAEIWAPRFQVQTKEVTVLPNQPTAVSVGLRTLEDDYKKYQDELSLFRGDRFRRTLTGGAAVVTNLGLGYLLLVERGRKGRDIAADLTATRAAYDVTVGVDDIRGIRDRYDELLVEYEEVKDAQRTRFIAAIPILALTAGGTALLFRRWARAERTEPTYTPSNPFVGALRSSRPYFAHDGTTGSVGFTLNF